MDVSTEAFRERLAGALNASDGFRLETRWFDGRILLEVDGSQCWLKVYRGQVIDTLPFTPPLGYTFKLSGPLEPWRQLVQGERKLVDLITPGARYFASDEAVDRASTLAPPALRIEGNTLEASRIHEALYHLADCVVATARAAAPAAAAPAATAHPDA